MNWKHGAIVLAVVIAALVLYAPSEGVGDAAGAESRGDDIGIGEMSEQEFEELAPEDVPEPPLEDWQLVESPPCEEREGIVAKEYCYRNMALDTGDAEYCDKIGDASTKSSCLSGVASITGDATLCHRNSSQEQKNYCFFSAAVALEDPFVCQNITDSLKRDRCLEKVLHNVISLEACSRAGELEAICGSLEGNAREDCLDWVKECMLE